jgi:hypothetical protein
MWSTSAAPSSVALVLDRVRPAKGPGRAHLSTAAREALLATQPGEHGLDVLAERLRAIGVQVRAVTIDDV